VKAVILAAGKGKRLKDVLGEEPKALLKICGIPMIERLIRVLVKSGVQDLVVIIRKDATNLRRFLEDRKNEIKTTIVQENTESTMASFFALEPYLRKEPFLLLTVDTFYKEEDFSFFIDFCRKNPNADLLLSATSFILDEKPAYVQFGQKGRITAVGRKYLQSGRLVLAGMYYCSPKIYREMDNALRHSIEHLSDFFGWVVVSGYDVRGIEVSKVIDVDDEGDIKEAEELVESSKT
jgi:MurNAc alpha-1-phosphate uridylyltransferase